VYSGQPFPPPHSRATARTIFLITISAFAALASSTCGGSTAVTNVVGPDGARCQTTASAQPSNVGADGGSVSVSVSAARDCTWSATSDASWMQLSATSGQGDGSLTVNVARNDQATARSGGVSINTVRVTVSQEARPCTFELRGPEDRMSSAGGRGSIQVTSVSGCTWNVSTSASWIQILTTSGVGSGAANFDVAPNGGTARAATITVGNAQFTLMQAGAGEGGSAPLPPSCSPALSVQTIELPQGGGNAPIALTIAGTCDWTAAAGPSDTWLTVAPGGGRGNGTITVTAGPNVGAARTATVTIAQQPVTITQPGSCAVNTSPSGESYGPSGGQGTVHVETASGCNWSASSNQEWARLTQSTGSGTGDARYNVAANSSTSSRTAIVTIGSRQHTITQRGCSFTLTPPTRTIPADGGSGTFQVQTEGSCPWSVSGSITGMPVTPMSGSGNGEVSYTVPANTTNTPRTITLRVGGQTHVITQAGQPAPAQCSFQLDSGSQSFPAGGGGPTTVRVNATPQGCAGSWSVTNAPEWVQVTGGSGSGSGQFTYTVAPNPGTDQRTATLNVNGQAHVITQAGVAPTPQCSFQLDSGSQSFPAGGGGPTTVRVNATPQGCAGSWSVINAPDWVQVSGGSGSGSGQFTYTVAANPGTDQRTATLNVNGQAHVITQAGVAPTPQCTFQLDSASRSFSAQGGPGGTVRVTATPQGCAGTWSVSNSAPDWVQVSGGSGSGSGEFSYTVLPNGGTAERTATLTVGGQAHVITQAGVAPTPQCTFQLDSGSRSFPAQGGPGGTVRVTATPQGCAGTWSVSNSSPDWVQVSGGSGSGPGEFSYTVLPNSGTADRTATLTVSGQTHVITQAGTPAPTPTCSYSIDPERREFSARGGAAAVRVITGATCAWRAQSSDSWVILVRASGTGSDDVAYLVAPNTSNDNRRATVAINGQVHRIDQRKDDDDAALHSIVAFESRVTFSPADVPSRRPEPRFGRC